MFTKTDCTVSKYVNYLSAHSSYLEATGQKEIIPYKPVSAHPAVFIAGPQTEVL